MTKTPPRNFANTLRFAFRLLLGLLALSSCQRPQPSPYQLTIYTSSRQLDYACAEKLLKSIARTPKTDVGHAWVKVQGRIGGRQVKLEGGHMGEHGAVQAKYMEGVMDLHDYGYLRPTEAQRSQPRYEPNPIRYIWASQWDGHWARGPSGHKPSYAATVELTAPQFVKICAFLHPNNYDYQEYNLASNQCSTLVAKVATLAGLDLEHEVRVPIEKSIQWGKQSIRLREDGAYGELILSTPDKLEASLKAAVRDGHARRRLDILAAKIAK